MIAKKKCFSSFAITLFAIDTDCKVISTTACGKLCNMEALFCCIDSQNHAQMIKYISLYINIKLKGNYPDEGI